MLEELIVNNRGRNDNSAIISHQMKVKLPEFAVEIMKEKIRVMEEVEKEDGEYAGKYKPVEPLFKSLAEGRRVEGDGKVKTEESEKPQKKMQLAKVFSEVLKGNQTLKARNSDRTDHNNTQTDSSRPPTCSNPFLQTFSSLLNPNSKRNTSSTTTSPNPSRPRLKTASGAKNYSTRACRQSQSLARNMLNEITTIETKLKHIKQEENKSSALHRSTHSLPDIQRQYFRKPWSALGNPYDNSREVSTRDNTRPSTRGNPSRKSNRDNATPNPDKNTNTNMYSKMLRKKLVEAWTHL